MKRNTGQPGDASGMSRARTLRHRWSGRGSLADRWLGLMDVTPAFGWTIGFFIFALSLIPRFMRELSPDSTAYLYLAGRMLDGADYYTGFFEFNTPFAVGVYTIPVALARWLDFSPAIAAEVFVSLLVMASIGLSHCLIRRSREYASPLYYNAIIITLFFALSYPSNFYYNEFATKGMLYLAFILPYIFSVQLRIEQKPAPRWLEAVVSILLGLTLCLKPHYVLLPAIIETYMAIRMRRTTILWRWQNLLAVSIAAVFYLVLIPVLFPGYIKLFPLFFAYYGPIPRSPYDEFVGIRLTNLVHTLFYLSPLLLWYWALRRQLPKQVSRKVFLVALGASTFILNAEALFSEDQLAIFVMFICLPFLYSVLAFSRQMGKLGHTIGTCNRFLATFAVILGSILIFGLVNVLSAFDPTPDTNEQVAQQMMAYVKRYAPNGSFYAISEDAGQFAPLALQFQRPARPILYVLQMLYNLEWRRDIYHGQLPANVQKAAEYIGDSTMHYFTETPPALVFISRYNTLFQNRFLRGAYYCFPTTLEILLKNYPAFRTVWEQHYQKIGTIIVPTSPRLLENRPPRMQNAKFGDQTYRITFPPASPIASWLDVYIRKG